MAHSRKTPRNAPGGPIPLIRMYITLIPPCFVILIVDNTWNAYACHINETVVLENAKFINESGLLKAGYEYFVIDGITARRNLRMINTAID
jgi:hypothetical protein